MANTDNNAERLKAMVRYIEQDGHEKAEEIDVLADEEYYIEKRSYLDQRIIAVKKYYDNLENKYKQQIILDIAKIKNQAYRDILSARNAELDDVLLKVRVRLAQLNLEDNLCLYKKVLFHLAIQGLIKIMEPQITVQVRKKDVNMAKSVMTQAQSYFTRKTGMNAVMNVSEVDFLPDKHIGGIIMHTKNRSISINNTLDLRLDLVGKSLLPYIRQALFGVNTNRKHLD